MPQWGFSTVAFPRPEFTKALKLAIPVHIHPEAAMIPDEILHDSPHSHLAQISNSTDPTNFSNSKHGNPLQDVKSFGFLSLTVFPGYKRAYFDEETIIGFSEKILVPTGNHTLALIAPEGYNDTSMTITISQGQTLNKTVRLRNKQTGRLAPRENKNTGSGGRTWLTWLRISCLSVGVVASAFAYREMEYASDAQDRYRSAGILENHNQLYNTYRDHLRMRNYLGIVSGVLISTGFVLWFF